METITGNLSRIHKRIQETCIRVHRDPKQVRLLLATKIVDTDKINFALQQGETIIGENKVQELNSRIFI